MRDAFVVRVIQSGANRHGVLQCLIERERPLELCAFDLLHDQVIRADIVQNANIGMIQRRDGFGFSLEAFAEIAPQ